MLRGIRGRKLSSFWVSIFQLIFGTVLSQLIPILLQPLLRRWFTPEEFGVMAVYFSIVSIVCVIVNLNYQNAIVLPEEDEDAMALTLGTIGVSAINSIVIAFIFMILGEGLLTKYDLNLSFKVWIWLLPFSIFLNSCNLVFTNWLIRKKQFKMISINKISRRSAEGIVQVGSGLGSLGWGLNGGVVFGDFVNFLTFLFQYLKSGGKITRSIFGKVPSVFKRYKEFPLISFLPNILSTITMYLPVIMVSTLFSSEITGQLDLSRQMLALPLALIAASVSQVILQEFTEKFHKRLSIETRFYQLLFLLVGVSAIMCIFISFFGTQLFVFIFGEQWLMSGKITEVLVWSYAIKLIVSPLSSVFIVFEKLKVNAGWQVANFLVMLIFFMFEHSNFDQFIYSLVFLEVVMYSIYGLLIAKTIRIYQNQLINEDI